MPTSTATEPDFTATAMNGAFVDRTRIEANAKLDPHRKGELGQFMTPFAIAEFMASLFERCHPDAVLLDPGAGVGSLTAAAAQVLRPRHVEAWEIDPVLGRYLENMLAGLDASHRIHAADFIEEAVELLSFGSAPTFTHAILNPPYRKIASRSRHRLLLRQVGIETVNLYTAFLALAILLVKPGGEIVAIVPRSFCNGPYYRPFRELMLGKCSLDRIHVFESRTTAFKDDDVLQENIILKLTRGRAQGAVGISHGLGCGDSTVRTTDFGEIVAPRDGERFIRIPTADAHGADDLFAHPLHELGLEVCTGPVVDFRLREWYSPEPGADTVPLLYPHHYSGGRFIYPRAHKKPNALRLAPQVEKWLLPNGYYALVRRFSAKEERRRIVAYAHDPRRLHSARIGFENHWNVFHAGKRGLEPALARGLACFLNSSVVDRHFRIFSGHTQVNATDLRNMRYPSLAALRRLGRAYRDGMAQGRIDELVETVS
jgi:adenine-specific DNA-methyltransferase